MSNYNLVGSIKSLDNTPKIFPEETTVVYNTPAGQPFTLSPEVSPKPIAGGYMPRKDVYNIISPKYKYAEDKILKDLKEYLDATYSGHYTTDTEDDIQCFDAWIAMGDATPTFRNTALKYLWRYGKKDGSNKKDLMKALHYIFLTLYNDHYKNNK